MGAVVMGAPAAGGTQVPNEFLSFRDTRTETRHPIRLYSRNIDKVHMLLRFNADDSKVPSPPPVPACTLLISDPTKCRPAAANTRQCAWSLARTQAQGSSRNCACSHIWTSQRKQP